MSNPIVIDIETRPDAAVDTPEYWEHVRAHTEPKGGLKDPLKIQADIDDKVAKHRARMALSPVTAMISVIGVQLWHESEPVVIEASEPSRQAEQQVLSDFGDLLADSWDEESPFITFNGRLFDLPMLAGRICVLNANIRIPKARDYRRHVDIYDDVFGKNCAQADWIFACGGGLEGDVDHSKLSIPEQAAKCRNDVLWLAELARRTQGIWGSR